MDEVEPINVHPFIFEISVNREMFAWLHPPVFKKRERAKNCTLTRMTSPLSVFKKKKKERKKERHGLDLT